MIGGAAVAVATAFFLIVLGAGFGLTLMPRQPGGGFFTLGAIYFLAAQAFGFVAGGHVTGRLIGPALESKREEEWRAGLAWPGHVGDHGGRRARCCWRWWRPAAARACMAMARAAKAASPAIGPMCCCTPMGEHAPVRGEELAQDKLEAARVLAADLHPGNAAHNANREDLIRLTAMDAGGSYEATSARVDFVEARMRDELDAARKAAGYAALWMACALLFGAVLAVASAISAGWEEDKLGFSMARRY